MRPRALALLRDDETVGESAFGYTQPSPPIWLLASLPASATPTSSILDRQHESTSRGAAPHHPGLRRLCPRLLPLRPGSVPLGSLPRLCLTRRSYPLQAGSPSPRLVRLSSISSLMSRPDSVLAANYGLVGNGRLHCLQECGPAGISVDK